MSNKWEWTGWSFDGLYDWFSEVTRGYNVDSVGKDQIDRTYENLDNPEFIDNVSRNDPLMGWLYRWYYDKRELEDRRQMDEDRYRNSGETWKNSPYSFYSYRHNSYTGSFNGGGYSDLFEASQSVIDLYKGKLNRWIKW